MMKRAAITAVGHYVPETVYPNSYFEQYLDTSDAWIVERTGIRERRFACNGATSDLIVPAARRCLEQRGIGPEEIDCIIVATVTPDYFFPNTAAVVQHKLGATRAWGFDLSAACSGFIYALAVAAKLIETGLSRRLLLCGADKMSAITNFEDRATAVLFGDAGGVVLLEPTEEPDIGILDCVLYMNGEGGKYLYMPAGGSAKPPSEETVRNKEHYVFQEGRTVFKEAVIRMAEVTLEIMQRNGLQADDIVWLVPHQANLRIITATAERMGLSMDRVMVNIDRYGNTTAATIPLCLSEWYQAGKLHYGDRLILVSFGAGYTWGAIYLRWSLPKLD